MRLTITILLLFSVLLCAQEKEEEATLFPSFTMEDIDGNLICLDSLKGQGPIFISFWATWCKPCIKELKEIEKLYRVYSDSGFVALAINEDGVRLVRQLPRYVYKYGFSFPVIWDDGDLKKRAAVTDLPTSFWLNAQGEIVKRTRGFKPGDEKEFKRLITELMIPETSEGTNEEE